MYAYVNTATSETEHRTKKSSGLVIQFYICVRVVSHLQFHAIYSDVKPFKHVGRLSFIFLVLACLPKSQLKQQSSVHLV